MFADKGLNRRIEDDLAETGHHQADGQPPEAGGKGAEQHTASQKAESATHHCPIAEAIGERPAEKAEQGDGLTDRENRGDGGKGNVERAAQGRRERIHKAPAGIEQQAKKENRHDLSQQLPAISLAGKSTCRLRHKPPSLAQK